ncbi:LysM peptidoglycan-binding domain-containing protein [Gracilibacillus sp. D59]|uniref:LysM peptidoglycan-binding domain-containing protein n=1 Tax=Gracilibacillus sp. D59 TaxID=3457434 RepID=UPI003FCCCCC3
MSIASGTYFIYTVQPGDTLYGIAQRFSSTPQAIANANYLYPPVANPDMIFPGQLLVVPANYTTNNSLALYVVTPGDMLSHIAIRFSTSLDLIAGINPGIDDPNVIFSGQQLLVPALIYNVEQGDTIYQLEQRFGIPRSSIIRANLDRPGFSADTIWPGYSLIIPLPTSENIAVATPLPGTIIQSGQQVSGWARAFEGNVLHQVQDSNGVVVSRERFVTASQGAPAYGWFQSSLPFDRQPTTNVGAVWVYTRSARTGEIQDLVQLKVYF